VFEGKRSDGCAKAISGILRPANASCAAIEIVPDRIAPIRSAVKRLIDRERLDLVLTAGGTGLGPRDVTPEAVAPLIEKYAPGIAEAMRSEGLKSKRTAMLSRSIAGTRRGSLLITLPGSPKGAAESLSAVWPAIPHALEILKGEGKECGEDRRD